MLRAAQIENTGMQMMPTGRLWRSKFDSQSLNIDIYPLNDLVDD